MKNLAHEVVGKLGALARSVQGAFPERRGSRKRMNFGRKRHVYRSTPEGRLDFIRNLRRIPRNAGVTAWAETQSSGMPMCKEHRHGPSTNHSIPTGTALADSDCRRHVAGCGWIGEGKEHACTWGQV